MRAAGQTDCGSISLAPVTRALAIRSTSQDRRVNLCHNK